jgi:hypothetical protein
VRWMELCGLDLDSADPMLSPSSSSEESFPSTTDTSVSSIPPTSDQTAMPFGYSTSQFDFQESIADMPMDFFLEPPTLYTPAVSTLSDQNMIVDPHSASDLAMWNSIFFDHDLKSLVPDITLPTTQETEVATFDPRSYLMPTASDGDEYEHLFAEPEGMEEMLYYNDPLASAEVVNM